jgi:hypothetical protein
VGSIKEQVGIPDGLSRCIMFPLAVDCRRFIVCTVNTHAHSLEP